MRAPGRLLLVSCLSLVPSRPAGAGERVQAAAVETVPSAVLLHHVCIPWERLEHIARRYDVSEEDIARWNGLDLSKRRPLYPGKRLKIHARRVPPLRQKLTVLAREDDTWKKIAKRHGVDRATLRRWNLRLARRGLEPGAEVMLWMESSMPHPALDRRGPPVPTLSVPPGGLSVGRPSKGKLVGGVQLPQSDMYRIRIPYQSYGTSYTVLHLQRAIATFRHRTAFPGEIVIGAMSRRTGRRLRPHKSHQSGRDVDIRMPAMPHARPGMKLRPGDVDWHATWALIEALVDTGAVQSIYLERSLQKRLRLAAKAMGTDMPRINAIIHPNGVVRHSPGHVGHIHVRFRCSPEATRCRR